MTFGPRCAIAHTTIPATKRRLRSMKYLILAVAALLLSVASASAQVGAILRLQVYQAPIADPATATPFRESTGVVVVAADCGKPLFPGPPPPVETNPRQAAWVAAATDTTICLKDFAAFFAALPVRGSATVGGYVSTITMDNGSGAPLNRSAASNPFSLLPPPPIALPAATGHQVRP